MRRQLFLGAVAAAAAPLWKSKAQTSPGMLAWVQADGLWIRELPDGN
jgi:hypothetical protein